MNVNEIIKPSGLAVDIDREAFARELKTWRLRQGMTQAEVGEQWGCSRYTILRAERAKPMTWEMAYRLFNKLTQSIRKEMTNASV